MHPLPTLELTFQTVAGSPWEGVATARFQGEPGAPFPVREHLTQAERDDLRWYIEDYPYTAIDRLQQDRARRIEAALEDYGGALWRSIRDVPQVQLWLGTVQARRAGRLELRAQTIADELAFRSPWELLRVASGANGSRGGTLLHQLGVTVVRRPVPDLPNISAPDTSRGLRVLAIVCRPDDVGFLDPRYTPQAMIEALEDRPEVVLDFCRPGTLGALTKALELAREEGRPYQVVHFDGHGTTLPQEGGIGALCFEKEDGSLDLVRSQKLGDLMSRFQVGLVVPEACRTSRPDFAQETVAGALLRRGVGTVVGMGHSVHVGMTRILMAGFYEAIARGRTAGEALQAGRNRVYADTERKLGSRPDAPVVELLDWFVPQLYQGGEDPPLLPASAKGPARRTAKRKEAVLAGLPGAPRAGFQGRAAALHRLERAVQAHPVVVLHAPGGMGKTALAREAARWWTRTGLFPDGAVFVSLEQSPSAEAVVSQVGQALEGEKFLQRKAPEKWLAEQLEARRLLIVWDNFESVLPAFQGGRHLPPAFAVLARAWTGRGSRVLITSRDGEVGFDAWPVGLEPLSVGEGLFLLIRLLERQGYDRAKREDRGWTAWALEPVVEAAGGHALALELVAPYIPKLGPEGVAVELGEILATAEQAHAEGRNQSLRASLEFSMRHLSPEARAALPAVGLLAGGCLESMAPDVVGVDEEGWAKLRGELERVGLLRVEGPCLKPHPVLGEVKGLAPAPAVVARFLEVVLRLCAEFDKLVRSEQAAVAMGAMAGSEGVVRQAIVRAAEAGDLRRAWGMADSLKLFLERSGRGREGAMLVQGLHGHLGWDGELTKESAALEREAAMVRAGADPSGALDALAALLVRLEGVTRWDTRLQRALTQMYIARIHVEFTHQPTLALAPLAAAEHLLLELKTAGHSDITNRAAVLNFRVNALNALGRIDESLAVAEESLELSRQANDHSGVAQSLVQIAQTLLLAGHHLTAEARYQEAIREAETVGDHQTLGICWQHLGVLALRRGQHGEAFSPLRKAFDAFQRAGDTSGQMMVLSSLGNVEYHRGDLAAALAWCDRSLELAIRLGDLEGEAGIRSNRAALRSQQAEHAPEPDARQQLLNEAIAEAREALPIFHRLDLPPRLAVSYSNLADYLLQVGQLEEAREHALKALQIREQTRDPEFWRTLWILEDIARASGDLPGAEDYRRRKEVAKADAERLSGAPSLPTDLVHQLLRDALSARAQRVPLPQVLAANGAPAELLAQLEAAAPWLIIHLRALAEGRSRPSDPVPPPFAELLDAAWQA